MHTVYIETYGCQMNVSDSELLTDLLAREGYTPVEDPARAELLIVNTCSVRDSAEKRARGRITELANAKRKRGEGQRLWVVGCMAQRLGADLIQQIPGIDRVIGAEQIETLDTRIGEYLENLSHVEAAAAPITGVSAFVPVMRGCDNFCAYCIVPYVRGREHSVPASDIEETVRRLAGSGIVEVTLLGQNVNSYADKTTGADFPALLRRLHALNDIRRIRFTTSHPKDCSLELIKTVAEFPKLCKHIHLPVQSGSSSVLARMNRVYTRDDYLRTVDTIRSLMPSCDITTDVITGFPGETDDDFGQTMSLFASVRFTTAFMFAYSPRSGTPAAAMIDNQVPRQTARDRLTQLIALQNGITREIYESMVGKRVKVLVTQRQRKRDRHWLGQDDGCKRVLVASARELSGTIVDLPVNATSGMTLLTEF